MKKLLMIAASFLVLTRGSLAATWTDQDTGVMWTYGTSTLGYGVRVSCASEGITGGVSIPAKIDGRDVVEIEAMAFRLSTGITSLRIPSTVIAIGARVLDGTRLFSDCADGLVVIDGCLFTYKGTCPSEIVVPDGVRVIADSAFERCSDLVGVTFPGTLRIIGRRSFCDTSISEVEIPEGVNEIRTGAFEFNEWHGKNASRLVSVSLPSTLEILGDVDGLDSEYYSVNPFAGCDDGCVFSFPKGNSRYSVSSGQIVTADGVLVSGCVSDGGVTIPSGVRMIACEAYAWQPTLRKITIPESVKTVCLNSFYGSGLEEVVMCDGGVEVIYAGAFWYCSNLSKITLPAGLRQVYGYFCGYTPIARLEMPASVEMLCGSFESMTNLSEVVFLGDAPEEESGFAQFYEVPQSAYFKVRLGSRGWDGDPYSAEMPTSGMWPGSYGDYGRPISTYGERPSEWDNGWWTTLDCMMSDDGWTQKDGVWQSAPWKSATYSSDVHTNYVELTFDGPGVFSCELKLKGRSQDDYAYVVVDGTDMDAVRASGSSYGDPKWRHVEYAVGEAGSHTIRVEYRIRNNYYGTEAIAYLQNVVWTPRSAWSRPDYVWTTADNGDGTVTITDVTPKPRFDVVIPAEIAGKKVTGVGDGKEGSGNVKLFYGNTLITSVIIPEGVVSLGANCFYGCYCLKHVSIPSSVTSIGDRVFYRCVNLVSVYVDTGDTERVRRMLEDSGFDVATLTFVEMLDDGGPYTETTSDGITWTFYVEDGEARIGTDGYSSPAISSETAGAVTIPSALGGRPVTSIGDYAFYNCKGLTSVTIPSSVTSIGGSAFSDCSGLTSVTIPSSVTSIGEYAFYGCSGLTAVYVSDLLQWCKISFGGSSASPLCSAGHLYLNGEEVIHLTIPNGVKDVPDYAFEGCKYITALTVPAGVETIGNGAFMNCSGLKELELPDGLALIGASAFRRCSSLEGVAFPNSVTDIGTCAFYECSSIKSVKFPQNLRKVSRELFYGCDSLESVEVPNGVDSIGAYAFTDCGALRVVNIPDSVTSVGEWAFSGTPIGENSLTDLIVCDGCALRLASDALRVTKSLTIPEGVRIIADNAFSGDSVMENVSLPKTLRHVGYGAFYQCSRLQAIVFPEGVESIGDYVLCNCDALRTVIIPGSVKRIGRYALASSDSVESVSLGEGIEEIAEHAFFETGYQRVYRNISNCVVINIPSTVKAIGSWAFYGIGYKYAAVTVTDIAKWCECDFTDARSVPWYYFGSHGGAVDGLSFPERSWGVLEIPYGPTRVSAYAFHEWPFQEIHLPSSVTAIESEAFAQSYVRVIRIPSSVVDIENRAFYSCKCLETVCVESGDTERVRRMLEDSGFDVSALTFVEMLDDGGPYTETTSDGITWTFYVEDGEARIGTDGYSSPAISSETAGAVTIPSALGGRPVTSIGDYAFYNCKGLTSVTIPPSVTSVGCFAFWGCGRIESVTIPPRVQIVGEHAFDGCAKLMTVEIPEGVRNIGNFAFSSCEELKSVTIPPSVTNIGCWAFEHTKLLNEHADGLVVVDDCLIVCQGTCGGDVVIPDGVRIIAGCAFWGCSELTNVTIPSSVMNIGNGAFESCSGLKSVTIPSSVMSIGRDAFSSCGELKTVYVSSGDEQRIRGMLEESDVDCDAIAFIEIQPSCYTVLYDANGGSCPVASGSYVSGASLGTLPTATREGYEFLGWFTATSGGTQVTAETVVTEDVTYYAHWEKLIEEVAISSVKARQRYPWNGLVDIVVTLQGSAADVAECDCVFSATNSATGAAIHVEHITQNGEDAGSGNVWTRKFIWDVKADVGAVKIDDVALTVAIRTKGSPSVEGGVQLWENGPYWAECNVGATKPEEGGYYFWWGDTVGYKCNSNNDGWISVKDGTSFSFNSGNSPTFGKNNSQLQSEGYIDATGNLVAAHDAATAHFGAPWRMPTDAELSALITNCDTEWTSRNGVSGQLVKGRGAYASKSIFLPAAGYGYDSYLDLLGSDGGCWSSTPFSGYSGFAWNLYFCSSSFYGGLYDRGGGQSVRPVRGFDSTVWTSTPGAMIHFAVDCREFVVTFDANGGTCSTTSRSYESGSALGTLPSATRSGYTFDGWFTAASGGAQVTAATVVTSNVTYYAHWEKAIARRTEIVDGIEWTYEIRDGMAWIVQNENNVSYEIIWDGEKWVDTADLWESGCHPTIPATVSGVVTVPARLGGCKVIGIDEDAFSGLRDVTEIVLPEGLEVIGDWAFTNTGIRRILFPSSIRSFGENVFEDCHALKEVRIPDCVTHVRVLSFTECVALESVVFPSSVTKIDWGAFAECINLKSVTFEGDCPAVCSSFEEGYRAGEKITCHLWSCDPESIYCFCDNDSNRTARYGVCLKSVVTYVNPERNGWSTYLDEGTWQGYPIRRLAEAQMIGVTFDANGGTGVMTPLMCEAGRVYKLPKCGFAKPEGKTRFVGWAGSNGRRYDDEMLIFNLAQPGGTVKMTAIWE